MLVKVYKRLYTLSRDSYVVSLFYDERVKQNEF
nr:MAG TPA: hypothetical protein [Caudoviricetes sp.]